MYHESPDVERTRLTPLHEAVIAGAAVVAAYVIFGLAHVIVVGAYTDDGIYVALGRAIATGAGFRSTYLAGAPVQQHYPPGLPALYSIIWRFAGSLAGVMTSIRVLNLVLCGSAAAVLWWLGRVRFGISRVTLVFLVIGPMLLESSILYFNLAIAEAPFLFLWAVSLLVVHRANGERSDAHAQVLSLVAGLLLAAAVLIRTQAVAIVPGFAIALLFNRRGWRNAAILIVAALAPLVAWQLVHARLVAAQGAIDVHPREWPYIALLRLIPADQLAATFLQTLRENVPYYWSRLSNYLAPGAIGDVLCAAFVLMSVIACLRAGRKRIDIVVMVGGSFALIVLWPIPSPRFVLPLLPFVGLLCGPLFDDWRSASVRRSRIAAATLAGCALTVFAQQASIRRDALRHFEEGTLLSPAPPAYFLLSNSRYLLAMSSWLVHNTLPTDRILTGNVGGIHLLTGRATMWPEPTEQMRLAPSMHVPGEYLARSIERDGITIVVIDNPATYLAFDVTALEQRCPGVLQPLGPIEAGPVRIPAVIRAQPGSPCVREWLASLR